MINIKLNVAKRAAEIIQEKEQAISYLNINSALNQASREFKSKEVKNNGDIKRIIREIVS